VEAAAKTFRPDDTRPLKVFFQDEARFGRMYDPVYCWAPKRVRPRVPLQRIREYTHVYSAVCPKDGNSFSMILPYADTDMMRLFLREFTDYFRAYRVVMVLDGAAWHKGETLRAFDNLRLLYQPPHSPELNPAEHLWDHLRETYFGNRYWESLDDLEQALDTALREVMHNPYALQSIVGFHWAIL